MSYWESLTESHEILAYEEGFRGCRTCVDSSIIQSAILNLRN